MAPTPPVRNSESREGKPLGVRVVCADCGEPVELAEVDDPESWIHAVDANYFGDHTAWVSET